MVLFFDGRLTKINKLRTYLCLLSWIAAHCAVLGSPLLGTLILSNRIIHFQGIYAFNSSQLSCIFKNRTDQLILDLDYQEIICLVHFFRQMSLSLFRDEAAKWGTCSGSYRTLNIFIWPFCNKLKMLTIFLKGVR